MKNKRIIGLDAAKVFACFCVVLMHTLRMINPMVPNHPILYYLTRCSMPLFFMVSGFVQINKIYIVQKNLKILGVVLSWIFLYTILQYIRQGSIFIPYDMVTWFIKKGNFSVFWFFGTMMILYLLLTALNRIAKREKLFLSIFAIFVLLCTLMDIFNLINILKNHSEEFIQMHVIQTFRLWSWIMYYILGGGIGHFKIYEKYSVKIWGTMVIFFSIAATGYMCYMLNIATHIVNGEYLYDSLIVILWSGTVMCLFLKIKWERFIAVPVLSIFTSCLIPVYALHRIILKIMISYINFNGFFYELFCWMIVLIITVVLGDSMTKIPVIKKLTHL